MNIFITGANRGLGFEAARRLRALGHAVLVGSRDAERGQEAAATLGARFVQIDVADDTSVANAAADVRSREGHVDVLINNAAITGNLAAADELTGADAMDVFNTNVASIVRVTSAFLPLLRLAAEPAVVNVTSGAGSIAIMQDATRAESELVAPLYTASKSAVAMLTVQYAKGLGDVRFNAADPGYTATDFNGHSGPQTVTEGTDAIVTLATGGSQSGTGRIIDRYGALTW